MSRDKISAYVQGVVKEEAERIKDIAIKGAQSKAYMYPFKGLMYFLSHREIWKPLIDRLAPMITTSISVLAFMFTFAYIPQAAVLTLVNGPFAVFTTVLLILSESASIVSVLGKNFVVADALVDTFDAVLVANNMTNLVSEGRQLNMSSNHPLGRLGKMVKKPFARYTPRAFVLYLMYLPLNLIPLVGTIAFATMQGKRSGPTAHERYFQLKRWSTVQKQEWITKHQGAYTSFGIATMVTEMIPVLNVFFMFTNACGAALWAIDIERGRTVDGSEDVSMG